MGAGTAPRRVRTATSCILSRVPTTEDNRDSKTMTPQDPPTISDARAPRHPRPLDKRAFDAAYQEVILGGRFFEIPGYYLQNRQRYLSTMRRICRLDLPDNAEVLEIGGGQTALLMRRLFGDRSACGDLYDTYAESLTKHGVEHFLFDLTRNSLPQGRKWDLILLLEVVEHLPVPPYTVLEKLREFVRPGGYLFLTTPNLYRFRNVARLAAGKHVFSTFFYPDPGQSIGHPIEYSEQHIRWQLERAGFQVAWTEVCQLANRGSTPATQAARWLMAPLLARRLWRDNLVAAGRNPG